MPQDMTAAGPAADGAQPIAVHHPAHYGGAGNPVEAIRVIEDWGLGFHLGNALKYLLRAGRKPTAPAAEDLAKALWYADRALEQPVHTLFTGPHLWIESDDVCHGHRLRGCANAAVRVLRQASAVAAATTRGKHLRNFRALVADELGLHQPAPTVSLAEQIAEIKYGE